MAMKSLEHRKSGHTALLERKLQINPSHHENFVEIV